MPLPIPMNSPPPASSGEASLHHQLVALILGRHPGAMGEVTIELWEPLSQHLTAIIGQEGFDALYDRSLHIAAESHAWLAHAGPPPGRQLRFDRLKSALIDQEIDEATKAAVLLLSTFTATLSTLIGGNLTDNILRAAWGDAFEQAAQEISQWPNTK